ncbi:MAG: hypothetical protein KA035_02875 [Candidatus Levybacteria bacterium]|nr:hypothetical protein [Candidatus Levybacteria bacterium]
MKTITLCSSMSFYPDVLKIGKELEDTGWKVLYPESALLMKMKGNFDPLEFRESITTKDKGKFIKLHFKKELKSEAILVVNKTKNGIRGYIGGNALMEMGIAFNSGIRIYLLHAVSKTHPFYDEISAMEPAILNGKINNLK